MTRRVTHLELTCVFSKDATPVLTVEPPEEIVFETVDARGERSVPGRTYVPPPLPPLQALNPATGPVAVQGAEPGDTLVVDVLEIALCPYGYISAKPDIGVLKDLVATPIARAVRVHEGRILFNESLSFPIRPMIGTIGVAPGGPAVPTAYPGVHGGNMDCNDITVGSRVYLPVFALGALFALGDVHASMGDGETSGGGLDISADVTARVTLAKRKTLRRPIVETPSQIVVTYNDRDLKRAVRGVVNEAVLLLREQVTLTTEEAIMLVSTAGDLRISQACDSPIDVTVRLGLPKLFKL